jgi:hypothetical protein
MKIQRMGFILVDRESGHYQGLFLLRSGHDLECIISGNDIEPVNLAYTLIDRHANILDRDMTNDERVQAWRTVILACLEADMITASGLEPAKARLAGIHSIAAFGEPLHHLEDRLTVLDSNMRVILGVKLQEVMNNVHS